MMWCGTISPRECLTSPSSSEEEEESDSAPTQFAPSPSMPAVEMPTTAISEPIVVHIDIDYFFAQVEELRLGLRDRPLGVQQNMEVASVNYVARQFGLYNRISVSKAKRMCPGLLLVRGDNGVNGMQRYRAASQGVLRCVMGALDELPEVPNDWSQRQCEQASFDDFYLRLQRLGDGSDGAAVAWARRLRHRVAQVTGLQCTVGMGRTKLLAALATKRAKRQRATTGGGGGSASHPPSGAGACTGTDAITNAGTSRIHLCRARRGSSGKASAGSGPRNCRGVESCASASELSPSERELLYAARVADLKGAGLHGVSPTTRRAVLCALGEQATLGTVLAWLNRNQDKGATVKCLDSHGVAALRKLLYTGCDGSAIRYFQPPQSASVECSVRPSDATPATTHTQVANGYARLAPLLLARCMEDTQTFGRRSADKLVVKWKLFPGAREVRQAQVQWPMSPVDAIAGNEAASILAHAATEAFSRAVDGTSFRVSRVVLGLTYVGGTARGGSSSSSSTSRCGSGRSSSSSSSNGGGRGRSSSSGKGRKRPGSSPVWSDAKQRKIADMFRALS